MVPDGFVLKQSEKAPSGTQHGLRQEGEAEGHKEGKGELDIPAQGKAKENSFC